MYKKNYRNGQNIRDKVNVNKEENKLKLTVCSHVAHYRAVKINIATATFSSIDESLKPNFGF